MRIAVAIFLLALAPAAHAAGSDPLLSGYGGPGDGEQALLGQTLLLDTSAGSPAGTGTTAPAPSPDAIYEAAPAEPGSSDGAGAAAPSKPADGEPREERGAGDSPAASPSQPPRQQGTPEAVPVEPVSAPAPVAARDLSLLASLLVALLVLGAVARRLAVRAARERRPAPLQVP